MFYDRDILIINLNILDYRKSLINDIYISSRKMLLWYRRIIL